MTTVEETPVASSSAGDGGALVPTGPGHDGGHDPHASHTGVANAKLAMWLFLSSDCLFFGAFIATYLLYRDRPGQTGADPHHERFRDLPQGAGVGAAHIPVALCPSQGWQRIHQVHDVGIQCG